MSKRTFLQDKIIEVLEEFRNKHGELFVIYKLNASIFDNLYYITGDELDWEYGWRVYYNDEAAHQTFMLSEEENELKDRILVKAHADK